VLKCEHTLFYLLSRRQIFFCQLQDGCRTGELKDNANSVLFFKKLAELTREKAMKVKIAVEVSIRLVNIIFSIRNHFVFQSIDALTFNLQVYRLNDIMKHVDLLLFENTSPENRIALKKRRYELKIHMYEQFGTLDNTV
jgi:hypothetical protein